MRKENMVDLKNEVVELIPKIRARLLSIAKLSDSSSEELIQRKRKTADRLRAQEIILNRLKKWLLIMKPTVWEREKINLRKQVNEAVEVLTESMEIE